MAKQYKYLEERVAELEKKIARLENTQNAQPTLEEIKTYFEKYYPGMVLIENHYVHSQASKNRIAFFIKSNTKGILFHWETDNESTAHLQKSYPKVKALYPAAKCNPSTKYPDRITRLSIPIDQVNPLENILAVIKATQSIVGYI
jgi:DNA repair exonuclease SbcCD ATPase subunit